MNKKKASTVSPKKVCVIIPAYNEAKVIKSVIEKSQSIFQKSKKYSIDIIVVNDGSKDTTADEVKKTTAVLITHIINSGAGGATSTGLRYAEINNYDIAATMDADGQHDPIDVLAGITYLDESGAEFVIGSRLINSEGMSKTKVLGNKGLSLITFLLFGIKSSDSQSGLRIFSRKAIENLRWKMYSYEFCSEMLWRAQQLKLDMREYPIKAIYTDYSKGKGQNNWNAINILKSLIRQRILEFFK